MPLSTIISCTSMREADLPSNEALLAELDALEKELRVAPGSGEVSALVRLIRQDRSWPTVLDRIKLTDWIVLPLRRNKFPALNTIKEYIEKLTHMQGHDALTGLANRRGFDQALALEVERSARFKTPLSLCILDLDDFKGINDTHGHPCGDKILQAMGEILLTETRMIDVAARIGGEEFALLLPGTGLARAQKLLERVLESIRAARVRCDATELAITASMGVASYRGKEVPDPVKLVAEADKALYRAKRAGKNRLECAPLLDLGPVLDQTLVQQNEKRFLLSFKE